jgi:shikimate dehydrogenase
MRAVNTLNLQAGKIEGFNTDGPGLARAVEEAFGVPLGKLRVMIVGAGGGAGRAVALQCALEGCPAITLLNRTVSKAQELAEEIRSIQQGNSHAIQVEVPEHNAIGDYSTTTELILQCSSLGMEDGDPSPLPQEFLQRAHLVYDTIYSRRTQLISDASKAGACTADGRAMLLHQGALAFEIWFGKPAPVEAMRAALR